MARYRRVDRRVNVRWVDVERVRGSRRINTQWRLMSVVVGVRIRVVSGMSRVVDSELHQLCCSDPVRRDFGEEDSVDRGHGNSWSPGIVGPCATEAFRPELFEGRREEVDECGSYDDA
jgi:hypothetical protein